MAQTQKIQGQGKQISIYWMHHEWCLLSVPALMLQLYAAYKDLQLEDITKACMRDKDKPLMRAYSPTRDKDGVFVGRAPSPAPKCSGTFEVQRGLKRPQFFYFMFAIWPK
eukprot:TRINITY_DN27493_c0_g1_i2.p1 TRINITY_DN27493_c0_g1~~TRINITY_DN27493_c0_g1_i2.p1  ORF type:complete len:110 (-),score=4.87 TRINITY_DN27493_c0_g1_i2:251-580(-)